MRLDEVAESPHFREHGPLTGIGSVHPAPDALGVDPTALAHMVEDPTVPLATRLAAGGILALVGDPRIGDIPATCPIPGGTVDIGLPEDALPGVVADWVHVGVIEEWIAKEVPVHQVTLDGFWLCRYLVTNREYRDFLAATDHHDRPTTWYLGAYPYERANHPVAGVTAESADAYAVWLTRRNDHPWRLPSEPEWEHAAKGPGNEFPWGTEFDPQAANTRETGIHTTTPVGAFPTGRSPYGAYDMAGNVEEYVADVYTPYPGGQYIADHLVETIGTYRITRGGSFSRFGDLARTRRRHGAFPGPLYPAGFRLATSARPPLGSA